jgi:hypothetical protein
VNVWKVILATLVIYSAGLITGSLLVRQRLAPRPAPDQHQQGPGPMPWFLQQRFLDRMRVELNLTPEQTARLEGVFIGSRDRTRMITDLIQPEMQAEMRNTREQIMAELTPPQRRRFEELMRSRPNRMGEPFQGPRQRDGRFSPRNMPPGPSNRAVPPDRAAPVPGEP